MVLKIHSRDRSGSGPVKPFPGRPSQVTLRGDRGAGPGMTGGSIGQGETTVRRGGPCCALT